MTSAITVLKVLLEDLNDYEKRLSALSGNDAARSALGGLIGSLKTSADSNNTASDSKRGEANKLDQELKDLMFEFAKSTGSEKTAAFNNFKAQQIEANNFAERIRVEGDGLRLELEKLERAAKTS